MPNLVGGGVNGGNLDGMLERMWEGFSEEGCLKSAGTS